MVARRLVIGRRIRGGVLIADIILFPIGVIVDAITGAWYRLSPDPASVTLNKVSADLGGPDTIEIVLGISDKDGGTVQVDAPTAISVYVERQEAR